MIFFFSGLCFCGPGSPLFFFVCITGQAKSMAAELEKIRSGPNCVQSTLQKVNQFGNKTNLKLNCRIFEGSSACFKRAQWISPEKKKCSVLSLEGEEMCESNEGKKSGFKRKYNYYFAA